MKAKDMVTLSYAAPKDWVKGLMKQLDAQDWLTRSGEGMTTIIYSTEELGEVFCAMQHSNGSYLVRAASELFEEVT